MNSISKTLLAFGLLLTGFATSASADTYHHIDDLANRIANRSRQLTREVRRYRHVPEYRHLVEDANDMYQLADHIHEVAHHHGSISHLECDLRKLDSKFHHLESVFDRVERRASHGHVHCDASPVKRLLRAIEDDIHHLRDDIRELRRPASRDHHSSYRITVPRTYSPYGAYNAPAFNSNVNRFGPSPYQAYSAQQSRSYTRGRTISIGGGSSRLTFSF